MLSNRQISIIMFIATLILATVAPVVWRDRLTRVLAWIALGGGVVAAARTLTKQGTLRGLLIDERNRFSQPALITLAWFVVIVSAYLACAVWNLALWAPGPGTPLPLHIAVPREIWILAGIIGVDIVGTSFLFSDKKARPMPAGFAAALKDGRSEGILFVRADPAAAKPFDFIGHMEATLEDTPNLGDVQKLLFQIAAVIVYAIALGRILYATDPSAPITQFPAIPEGFLALLGISTATSLVNGAVPRKPNIQDSSLAHRAGG